MGWPADLSDDEILTPLFAFNHARRGGRDPAGTRLFCVLCVHLWLNPYALLVLNHRRNATPGWTQIQLE
jgi:hypothetical protein